MLAWFHWLILLAVGTLSVAVGYSLISARCRAITLTSSGLRITSVLGQVRTLPWSSVRRAEIWYPRDLLVIWVTPRFLAIHSAFTIGLGSFPESDAFLRELASYIPVAGSRKRQREGVA
jgi:hypothetical protein